MTLQEQHDLNVITDIMGFGLLMGLPITRPEAKQVAIRQGFIK